MNILYLSDIHFGREYMAQGQFEKRESIQQQLIDTVVALPENMKPHYIVVTGDIAWTGNASEYEMAYQWFKKLLNSLELTGSQITFCAGNHDVNRKNMTKVSLEELKDESGLNVEKIDERYQYENIADYDVQILAFNDFCNRLNVLPYWYEVSGTVSESDKFGFGNKRYSYTAGTKDIRFGEECYRFASFNTAMFSGYSALPDDENFLGLPQVEHLIKTNKIGETAKQQNYIIAIFHHAERFLNTNEMNSYSERPATLYKLIENVNLALCGHTETGSVPILRKQGDGGWFMNGGATYYSDNHPNSFSILHIEPKNEKIEYCTFIYKKGNWLPHKDIQSFKWENSTGKVKTMDAVVKKNSCTLKLMVGEKIKEMPVCIMDDGLYIDVSSVHRCFTNFRDVTRLLDITGNENGLDIKIAPGRDRMVSAMYAQLDFVHFIEENTNGGKIKGTFALLTETGQCYMAGVLSNVKMNETEKEIYKILVRLKKLEEIYQIHFSFPDTVSIEDQNMIGLLEQLADEGRIMVGNMTEKKLVYFSRNVQVFRQIINQLESDYTGSKTISISYSVPLQCKLLGATIPLGMCRIIGVNLLPADMEELKKQRDNFMAGDTKRLTLQWVNHFFQYVIIQENGEKKRPEVIEIEKKIEEDTFILEIEPQKFLMCSNETGFEPDNKEVEKQKMILANTMCQYQEVRRTLWERGMKNRVIDL